ncbi:hypothetical protein R1flu_025893 [Riccia fluitans]|uniref:Uncharacterized protein n=1 Tax=Riccia fluitans TaxID=41844 RepID=A0ABD1Y270_9MARC
MHDQSNLQEVVAKLQQEAAKLQTRIDEKRVELVSIQELETQINLKSRELVTLQANIDKLQENAAAGSSLFRPMPIPPNIPRLAGYGVRVIATKWKVFSKDGIPIFMKDFATLEFWNISTRDVLMIDDSLEKGMTNFPYSALYPPTFTPLVTSPDDDTYLNSKLLPWLKEWGKSVKVTWDYVQEWYRVIGCRDPVDMLVDMFSPLSQTVQSILWRFVPSRERKLLLNKNCNREPASPPTSHPPGPSTKSKNPPKHKRPRVAQDDVF